MKNNEPLKNRNLGRIPVIKPCKKEKGGNWPI